LPTSLLVVSPTESVDRGAIIVNLAASFAEAGLRVAIVDADPRNPWLAPSLGLPERIGFIDLIQRTNVSLWDAIRPLRIPGVSLLSAGIAAANSTAILSSPRVRQVIEEIQQSADLVLYGCAPAMRRSDATVLAAHLGQAVLLVDAHRERREMVLRTVADLERAGASVAGAVIANADASYFLAPLGGARDLNFAAQPVHSAAAEGEPWQLHTSAADPLGSDRYDAKTDRAIVNHQ
jgi:capsular exopolysaccharide synthesis family protein